MTLMFIKEVSLAATVEDQEALTTLHEALTASRRAGGGAAKGRGNMKNKNALVSQKWFLVSCSLVAPVKAPKSLQEARRTGGQENKKCICCTRRWGEGGGVMM